MAIGVKNQIGKKIITAKTPQIMKAEIFFEWIFLVSQVYAGSNIKARIIPKMIESKIGLRIRKDRTISTAKMSADIIFLI